MPGGLHVVVLAVVLIMLTI